jgi:hypothetical protein
VRKPPNKIHALSPTMAASTLIILFPKNVKISIKVSKKRNYVKENLKISKKKKSYAGKLNNLKEKIYMKEN